MKQIILFSRTGQARAINNGETAGQLQGQPGQFFITFRTLASCGIEHENASAGLYLSSISAGIETVSTRRNGKVFFFYLEIYCIGIVESFCCEISSDLKIPGLHYLQMTLLIKKSYPFFNPQHLTEPPSSSLPGAEIIKGICRGETIIK